MKRRNRKAFTMLELLVAMALLTILVVMLFGMVDAATKLWRENENNVDAYREARAALNVITDDLKGLIASTNTNFFATNFVGIAPTDAAVNKSSLFFLTPFPSSAQPTNNRSDIGAVGYYLRWTKQNSGFGTTDAGDTITTNGFHLFRAIYSGDLVFSNVANGLSPLQDLAQHGKTTNAPEPEILARNICDFHILCYQTNASGNLQTWAYSAANPVPQMIAVQITAISDQLAKKLSGVQSRWTTNDAQVAKDMRTFISRVPIPALPAN
jgi:prepilin-type N-terminal cleavage/methylation domain-containing protein